MAWGPGGKELRDEIRKELALTRQPMYRLKQAADKLAHPEKGVQMRGLVATLYETFERMEALLNR